MTKELSNPKQKVPTSLRLKPESDRSTDLAFIEQMDLLSPDQVTALSTAVEGSQQLLGKVTPLQDRHFNKIGKMLSIQSKPGSSSRLLGTLADFNEVFQKFTPDLHKYRKLYFQAMLKQAEMEKLLKQIEECEDPTEVKVMQAQAMLLQAEVDELQSQVEEGYRNLKDQLEEATECGERYQRLLKESGRQELTKEEIEEEELLHYLKAAFWHAGQVFVIKEVQIDPRGSLVQQYMTLQKEVIMYFEAVGITLTELDQEFMGLNTMRENHLKVNPPTQGGRPPSFAPYFESWLEATAKRYLPRIKEAVAQDGRRNLERIAKMIAPTEEDKGGAGPGEEVERTSIFD